MGSVAKVLGLRLFWKPPLSFVRVAFKVVRIATIAWRAAILVALLVGRAATTLAAYSLTTVLVPPMVWRSKIWAA